MQLEEAGASGHGEPGSWACNGCLGVEPPAGSWGRAASQRDQGAKAPWSWKLWRICTPKEGPKFAVNMQLAAFLIQRNDITPEALRSNFKQSSHSTRQQLYRHIPDRFCKSVSIVLMQHAVKMKACTNALTLAAVSDKPSSVTVIMTVETGRRNSLAVSDNSVHLLECFAVCHVYTFYHKDFDCWFHRRTLRKERILLFVKERKHNTAQYYSTV